MYNSARKFYVPVCLTLAVTTLIAFAPLFHNGFISFDDGEYIYANSHITSGLTLQNVAWAFTSIHANNYHPLTSVSIMLDCELFGLNPAGHHLVDLLFHIANTLLLFFVLSRSTKKLWQSAFVAALFALHPLHVESVAWASERKDVLSGFFWMLVLLAYVRYVEKPGVGRYLLTLPAFTLGLLSKPMLVTLPFVLLLLDYWPLDRFRDICFAGKISQAKHKMPRLRMFARLILEKAPFFALSALVSDLTFTIQQQMGLVKTYFPLSLRIENAVVSCLVYMEKMFWPADLAIFYPYPLAGFPAWQIIVAVSVLVVITFLALWKLHQRPYFAVGWLWFLGTLIPVIGLIQVGFQARADRYTYIPYIGLFIIIAWGVCDLFARVRHQKIILSVSGAVILSAIGIKTFVQTTYWHDSITLYQHAVKVTRNNWWAYHFLGNALIEKGRLDEGVIQLEESLRIDPQNVTVKHSLAQAFLDKGDVNKAIELYQQLLVPSQKNNSGFGVIPVLGGWGDVQASVLLYFEANVNLGIAYYRRGDLNEAVRCFTEALRVQPGCVVAHKYLGDIYFQKGKIDEAARHYTFALQSEAVSEIDSRNLKPDWKNEIRERLRQQSGRQQ